jgi:hypothetical protein
MNRSEMKQGAWKRMRWLWLAFAILGLLLTPSAIANAIDSYKADHRLGWIIPLAFALRFGQIWLFAWLWWKYRPSGPERDSGL